MRGHLIDYDRATYATAMAGSSLAGTEEGLWLDYYDEQWGMLQALRPRVVGHFDLIRLLSEKPGRNVKEEWPSVWEKIKRNLDVVMEQGGWLECNSAALRKGLDEPYPCRVIAEVSFSYSLSCVHQGSVLKSKSSLLTSKHRSG